MLYTTNFAFVGLCEAAKATQDTTYIKAVNQMRDFLIRIQVRSDKFKNVDGAWFRAFNYEDWNYWASNADAGWGSSRMLLAHGFLRKVFEIFESYQTSIDMICTSEVGVSVSVDNTKHLNEILDDLKKYGTVTVDKDMCIVCVVGDLEWENVGFEAKALDAMRDIPVRMISFGGSNYNISFLIRECDKNKALQSLSDALFNEE